MKVHVSFLYEKNLHKKVVENKYDWWRRLKTQPTNQTSQFWSYACK